MRRCKRTLYFAHPISLYNTLIERVIVSVLEQEGFTVVNPGATEFQREYTMQRHTHPQEHPMGYWLRLSGTCASCAFTTFPKSIEVDSTSVAAQPRVSAGVVKEVNNFRIGGKPVWWISPDFNRVEDIVLVPFKTWRGFRRLTVKETESLLRTHNSA